MKRRTFLMLTGGAVLLGGAPSWPQTKKQSALPGFRRYPIPAVPIKPAQNSRIPFNFPRPAPTRYALQSESRGIQLYSTELDRVRCVYFLEGIEWVGGLAGLKRVDQKRNEVRVYSTEDGLPEGSVLQVVAAGAEVYAVVVRPRDGLLSFCALDAQKEKWVVLTQRAQQNQVYGVSQGGALAISTDWVAFVPEVTLLTEERRAPFYLYNRRTNKLQPAAWDPVIAADHRKLETQSALIHGTMLWLGTQLGLLGVPLTTVTEPVRWRRLLPDRQVQSTAMLEAGKVAVLSMARSQDEFESDRQRRQGNVELQGVELATGKALTLPDIPSLTAKVSSFLLREGVALWLLSAEKPGQANSGFGQSPLPLALRLAPKATQWEPVAAGQLTRPPNFPPNFPMTGPLEVADASMLPDLVAGVLVCLLGQQEPWLEQRFWRWRSPEVVLPAAVAQPSQAYGSAEQVDPSDPNLLWLTEGDAFISVPRSERPAWEPLSMAFINGRPAMRRAPLTSPQAKRFPVDMAQAREGIRVGKLLSGSSVIALPDGNRRREALLLQPDGSVKTLEFESVRIGFTLSHLTAVAGARRQCYVHHFPEKTLSYWNEATKSYSDSGVVAQQTGYQLAGGTAEGLWWRGNTPQQLRLQRLTEEGVAVGEPEETTLDFSSLWGTNSPDLAAAAGGHLWFEGYSTKDGRNQLAGWSPLTKRWSAPAPAARSYGDMDFLVTPDGSCWLAAQSAEAALLGYFPDENRWEQIAPPAGMREGQNGARLLAADEEAFWVSSSQGLWCYRRKTKTWEKSSLEPPWDVWRSSSLRTAPAGTGMWWVATPQGLWRFDVQNQTFTEATLPAGSGFLPLHLKAVTPTAIWGMKGSLLARLDRQSGTAQLYGRESGMPESSGTRLREAGGTAWLIESGQPLYSLRRNGKLAPYPLPPESKERSRGWRAVATDPSDPTRVILAAAALYRAGRELLEPTPLGQPEGTREIYDLLTLGSWVYAAASDGLWRFNAAQKWERLLPYSFGELQLDPEAPRIVWARSGQYPGSFSNQLARLDTTRLG